MDIASKPSADDRIAARWDRIKSRRQKQDVEYDGSDPTSPSTDIISNKSISKSAIFSSRNRIGQLQIEARRQVSSVQLVSDQREYGRRQGDKVGREKLAKRVEEEGERSQGLMEEIDGKWAEIMEMKIPQQIADHIQRQEDQCNELFRAKLKVNEELDNEVKARSDQYSQLIKVQEKEISDLLQIMHEQFQNIQKGYEQELDVIEAAFLEERRLNLDANRKQIDECFENRRLMELQILDSKTKRDQKYQDDLDELRQRDTEDYNKLKMNLENNIQLLEQQLEEMRSTYQLNTEKLNYNFQVLKEREKENMETVDHQKRKLKRLQATLSSLKQKYAEQDKRFKQENHDLTEEYRRITRQYKELQKKFRHFEKVDNKKYEDIWSMNHESIVALVKKVVDADKIIHEQILCVPWQSPCDINLLLTPGHDDPTPSQAPTPSPNIDSLPPILTDHQGQEQSQSDGRLRKVLSILVEEAGFLIDAKTKEMSSTLSDNDRLLYQCDSILHALGVNDKRDLDEIVSMFYLDPSAPTSSTASVDQNSPKPIVHPNDFLKVIRRYVANKQSRSSGGGGEEQSNDDKEGHSRSGPDKANNDIRDFKKSRDHDFWAKINNVIDPQKIKVWNTLEQSLIDYNAVLSERAEIVAETRQLTEQNEQLKMLLDQYLSSDINNELNIPPSHVLHFPKI